MWRGPRNPWETESDDVSLDAGAVPPRAGRPGRRPRHGGPRPHRDLARRQGPAGDRRVGRGRGAPRERRLAGHHVLQARPAAAVGRDPGGLERGAGRRVPPQRGGRGRGPGLAPARRRPLRAVDDRRPADEGPRPHGRPPGRRRRPASCRTPGRQLHARRGRRSLGRPQEALPRGRPHRGRGGDLPRARVQLPGQVPLGRAGRRTPSSSCSCRSTRAGTTSRRARTSATSSIASRGRPGAATKPSCPR